MENIDLFDKKRFWMNIPKLLPYLSVNFKIVIYSTLFGSILGICIAGVKMKKIPFLEQILNLYISFMRGTPILVQLMLVYYGVPALLDPVLGTHINREWETILFAYAAFILNQGAFLSVIFYSAIRSVPAGQADAAYSVGLSGLQSLHRILIPQAVPVALPVFGSDLIGLFQNSSLVSMVGVLDIMGRARAIGSAEKHVLEAYIFCALMFMVFSIGMRLIFKSMIKKFGRHLGIWEGRGV